MALRVDGWMLGVVTLLGACPSPEDPSADTDGSSTAAPGESSTLGESSGQGGPSTVTVSGESSSSSTASTGVDTGTTVETSSSSGSTSTGGPSTEDSSSGSSDSSSGSASNGETGNDTGGDPVGNCDDACEVGCVDVLIASHTGEVTAYHAGSRVATLDDAGRLVLWDADELGSVYTTTGVGYVAVAGDTLVHDDGDSLRLVDIADGTIAGSVPGAPRRGIASDGSYVWTADEEALSVYEPNGSLRFAVDGPWTGAMVLALPDALHVFAGGHAIDAVVRVDATTQAMVDTPFTGDFAGWFGDAPQFWTTTGGAYRVYDAAGVQLAFAVGVPLYGWGDHLVLASDFSGAEVVDVDDTDEVLAEFPWTWQFSGPAVMSLDGEVTITRLDTSPLEVEVVDPACCVFDLSPWSFGWSDGRWVVGGEVGNASDEQGRALTPGQLEQAAGSASGRVGVATSLQRTHVWDVDADCSITGHGAFSRPSNPFWIAGGGSALVTNEAWIEQAVFPQLGARVYALPDGALVGQTAQGISSDAPIGAAISDDGSLFARTWANMGLAWYEVVGFPSLEVLHADDGRIVPSLAPNAAHIAIANSALGPFDTLADSDSYIFDPVDLRALIDGVARGFIDDEHILVAHYSNPGNCAYPIWECDVFESAELVDLDGMVVQEVPLPEILDFERVSATEILVRDTSTIYDVYSGEVLWQAEEGWQAAVAGPDHVLVTDGAVAQVLRWR